MIKNNIVKIGSYPYITKVARHSYKWLSILWEGGIYMAMIDTYRRNVVKKREDIAKLASDKAKEKEKIAKARAKIDSANATIRRTKNETTIKSKLNDITKAEKDITVAEKRIADIEKKSSKLEKELSDEQKKVQEEEEKLHKLRMKEEAEMQKKTQFQISELNRTIQVQEEKQNEMQNQIAELQKLPDTITVLFLASNPTDTPSLRLDAESRAIQEMIRKSEYRDTIKFETRWAVRTSDLLQAINEVNPDIIHFSGHGASNGDLAFENVNGQCKLVTKEAMAQTIMTLSDKVRLIFFNACFSAIQAEHIVEHVDAAIGMNTSIGDEAARVVASQFYSSLGFGKDLKTAFNQAKAALMLEGIPEETTPELFVRDNLQPENIILVQPQ